MNAATVWDRYFNPVTKETADLLTELVQRGGNGDHLEIGTLFGASAIHAALYKKEKGLGGKIVCIDPFEPGLLTPTIRERCVCDPTPEIVMENAKFYGVADRIEIIKTKSKPFPIKGRRFATTYIDGDHTFSGAYSDWENARQITDVAILLDDDSPILGPYRVAREFIAVDPDWEVRYQYGMIMAVKNR